MGYSHFDSNEEELMEVFEKQNIDYNNDSGKDTIDSYMAYIKILLRKKMIEKKGNIYSITSRGKSAIIQQARTGEYWVAPLHSKPFNPNGSAKLRVPKGYSGYFT